MLNAVEKNRAGQEERGLAGAAVLSMWELVKAWARVVVTEMIKTSWNLDKFQQSLKKARD